MCGHPHTARGVRTVDLFCGGGGFSLGFEQAGFDVVAAADAWDKAVENYRQNFSHDCLKLDLGDIAQSVKALSKYRPQVAIGGPPCQDFSSAGKQIEGERAMLTEAYAHIVAELEPQIFVMENVPAAVKTKTFARAMSILEQAGYTCQHAVLDASLYVVPQRRKRLFCIGSKTPDLPQKVFDRLDSRKSKHPLTVRQYLAEEIDFDFFYVHPRSYARRAVFTVDAPAPTMRGQARPIPPNYKPHPRDDGPIEQAVALSAAQRARIQTFPHDYRWSGTKTALNQIIGNAVPVNLAQAVGQAIMDCV